MWKTRYNLRPNSSGLLVGLIGSEDYQVDGVSSATVTENGVVIWVSETRIQNFCRLLCGSEVFSC